MHVCRRTPSPPQFLTLNLGLSVQRNEALCFWRSFHRGLEKTQQHGRQIPAHLLRVEVCVRPLVGVVAAGEFGERSGCRNGGIVGVESGVYNESAVEHQEGVGDAPEGLRVHGFIGEINEHLKGEKQDLFSVSWDVMI